MSEKVNLINPAKVDGRTPLDFAAMNGNLRICRFIIANSAEKNPKDADGITTLHLAARNGHLEVCRLLIDNVTDKNLQCNLGWTPFHEAAFGGNLEWSPQWNRNHHVSSLSCFKIDGALPLIATN